MRETWVQSLGWEDPPEKGMATLTSILAWRIPWNSIVHGSQSRTQLSDFHFRALLLLISILEFLVSLYIGFAIICNFYLKMNSKDKIVPSWNIFETFFLCYSILWLCSSPESSGHCFFNKLSRHLYHLDTWMTLDQGSPSCGVYRVSLAKTVGKPLWLWWSSSLDWGQSNPPPCSSTEHCGSLGVSFPSRLACIFDPMTWCLRSGCGTELYANHNNATRSTSWSTFSFMWSLCIHFDPAE